MSLSNNPSRRQSTVSLRLARAVVAGALLSGAVGSIGFGVVPAPAPSARPIDHPCDNVIVRINAAREAARAADRRGDYEQVQINLDNSLAAEAQGRAQGCLAED